jgi:hypothetical protein
MCSAKEAEMAISRSIRAPVIMGLALAAAAADAERLPAAEPVVVETEVREFCVSVDGKPRGTCTMRISRHDDGTDRVRCESALLLNFIVYRYRYSSIGAETWRDGRLVELKNKSNFNGTEYEVRVAAMEQGLRLTVDGEEAPLHSDVWVTSYWQLPKRLHWNAGEEDSEFRKIAATTSEPRPVLLLDGDKGRKLKAELEWIGGETLELGDESRRCQHYRLTGDVQVDLWYGAADHRLVKQESLEEGHHTALELERVSRGDGE